MISIKNLHAGIEGKEILKGIDLEIAPGQIHAIMGPNGSGKSTLSKIIAGDPQYNVFSGEVLFRGENILDMDPDVRALKGVFMAFQYPVEIPGVNNASFLRMAYNAKLAYEKKDAVDPMEFDEIIREKMKMVEAPDTFLSRSLNEGFSGGEKKRNEVLQMALLNPDFAVLDETDSGLDIDALKAVAHGINSLKTDKNAYLIITHYQRLLDYIKPDYVHILSDGKIVKTGCASLALDLEKHGYADAVIKSN